MSQSGDMKVRGAARGSYGPGNPPPPPPGSPPKQEDGKRGRVRAGHPLSSPQESPPDQKFEKPYRKLNRRQREARKQDLDKSRLDHGRDRERSSHVRYRNDPVARANGDGDSGRGSSFGNSQDRRQPLKETRHFTPDQIRNETYGTLSPGAREHDHYQQALGDMKRRPVARNEWPEEQTWSWRPSVGEYPGQSSNGTVAWQKYTAPPFDNDEPHQEHAGTRYERSSVASAAFDVEGEIDWGCDEPAMVSEPIRPTGRPTYGAAKPQHAARKGPAALLEWQSKKRGFSPPYDEQPRQHRPWKGSDHQPTWKKNPQSVWKDQNHQPHYIKTESTWGGKYAEHPPKTRSGKPRHRNVDDPNYIDMAPFQKPSLAVQSHEKLLAPDPALMPGPLVPDSVYDLRKYDGHITALHKGLPKAQRYVNGNGKVAPYVYGSVQGTDLGLCFTTFCTAHKCEMGVKCAWRHHPLTKAEREWIISYRGDRGKQFLEKLVQFWAVPDVPVPGASMQDR